MYLLIHTCMYVYIFIYSFIHTFIHYFLASSYVTSWRELCQRRQLNINSAALVIQQIGRLYISIMRVDKKRREKAAYEEARFTAGLRIKEFSVTGMLCCSYSNDDDNNRYGDDDNNNVDDDDDDNVDNDDDDDDDDDNYNVDDDDDDGDDDNTIINITTSIL
jgi:hypothetical protein